VAIPAELPLDVNTNSNGQGANTQRSTLNIQLETDIVLAVAP